MESEMKKEKMVIVDTRPSDQFFKNHIEGSLTIPLNKSFTNWAGWLLSYKKPILVIVKEEEEQEMVKALQSIGLDQIKAVFRPEIAEQGNGTVKQLTVDEFQNLTEYQLIDVRNDSEWKEGHLPEAEHIMLGTLTDRLANISKDKQIVVQCQAGGRSAIASSILQANGFGDVYNLQGGYEEFVKREISVS
jgi:hydroxyacylglutathione hydrolase